jgi:hypothetical protein
MRLPSVVVSVVVAALVALLMGCKPAGSGDGTKPRKIESVEADEAEPAEPSDHAGQQLTAAGVEITVPEEWVVLTEHEPNFALAYGAESRPTQIPVCTIELRRQGPGPLPEGTREHPDFAGVLEYTHGGLLGLVREFPGPDGASIVVMCRAPRASRQAAVIKGVFASLRSTETPVELPPRTSPGPGAIVELCTGTPARMTRVCARRADGAVYCGATTGKTLTRVALPSPAVQISCMGNSACARDAEGGVLCWDQEEPPTPLPGLTRARDIVDVHVVDTNGALLRRSPDGLVELAPLGDAALKLTEVERVLAFTTEGSGCVLRQAQLWCWGAGEPPRAIMPAPRATGLRRMGRGDERSCVEIGGRWTCRDSDGQQFEFDGCEARPCGCSAVGATRLSCEDAPYQGINARPLGRVSDVIALAEPCAGLLDGTVVCRGPAVGQPLTDDSVEAIDSELPGITHVLQLK